MVVVVGGDSSSSGGGWINWRRPGGPTDAGWDGASETLVVGVVVNNKMVETEAVESRKGIFFLIEVRDDL